MHGAGKLEPFDEDILKEMSRGMTVEAARELIANIPRESIANTIVQCILYYFVYLFKIEIVLLIK